MREAEVEQTWWSLGDGGPEFQRRSSGGGLGENDTNLAVRITIVNAYRVSSRLCIIGFQEVDTITDF